MCEIETGLVLLAVFQLTFVGVYFLLHFRGVLPRLISLFTLCLSSYLLVNTSFAKDNFVILFLLYRLATLAPYVIWVISLILLVDGAKIHWVAWVALAIYQLMNGGGHALSYFNPGLLESTVGLFSAILIPQFIMFMFAAIAVFLAVQGYKTDLLEHRRRFRIIFVACLGVLLLTILGYDFINLLGRILGPEKPAVRPSIPVAYVSLYVTSILFLFGLTAFRLNAGAITLISDSNAATRRPLFIKGKVADIDPKLLEKVYQSMDSDKLYTQTGLSISDLANHLSIQEYKLRRIINKQLNYRNFSQFLNHYRLKDACSQLRNTSLPISTIALEVGFGSLSVFNKSFKRQYGITPTEYRQADDDFQK